MSGPVVKNHILIKKEAGNTMPHGRLTYLSLFRTCHLDLPASLRVHPQHRFRRTQWKMIFHQVQQPHDVGIRTVEHWRTSCKIPQKPKPTIKMSTSIEYRESRCDDLPEWLAEFTDNFVDEEVSASSEAPPSISREPRHQEPSVKVVSGKHSILTRFPKDRNWDQNYNNSLQKTRW